jgi:RNA 2',3'-cyclic 3'-phosphodiesterase
MPRLFTALEVPASLAPRLAMLRDGLNGAHWVLQENYHITLRFVGDIDEPAAQDFADALAAIEMDSFDVKIAGLGSFGGSKPRVIFAALKPCDALERLAKAHDRAARIAGLPPEPRNFTPHITLARLKNAKAEAVARYLECFGGFCSEAFPVSRFTLQSARAVHGGGPYVIEGVYPLGGGWAERCGWVEDYEHEEEFRLEGM